ncbi:peptidoglycan-associated lipoprotein Pal [Ramlibacter alkalitolerans]|uniref:Peptidoglycan-associated lipoprotein n=1 Tax=Ramlibacter alkalitolerans TaxID=2039631 RepID=A0ABS1JPQ1_9BURK|nr:peptidoglycan-associated lipoprotein Pal [Ramlibacter alkalitolerans]MBL0426232.1 peptidoglycan-associated lipoprotein Pal [Ramlibacter alkalitolerans]
MNPIRSCLPILLTAVLAACSTPPKPAESTVPEVAVRPTPPVATVRPAAPASTSPAPQAAARPEYLDPNSPLARQRTIFFGYDDFGLGPEDQAIVQLQGAYLARHPEVAVRLEGNADERGSPEYNLALGNKRAEAVQRALRLLGVKDTQVEAISWGEEKPRASGHDEAAWAQNRRVDFVYPAR